MKRPNQVLALRVIDADLAADRAVDLREERGRDLHDGDAAEECGGGKTRGVAEHTSANGDDGARAIGAPADQRVIDAADCLQVLVTLAVGKQDRIFRGEPGKSVFVQTPHGRIRHDETPRRNLRAVEQRAEARRAAGLYVYAVAPTAAADLEKHG